MQRLTRGILIPIEGIDGSGKSTLAHSLFTKLKNQFPVHLTKEPGGSELGKQLRTILQTQTMPVSAQAEYLLFAADRAQHFDEVIIPNLEQNKIILSDRMCDSSLVYQGYGRGLDLNIIKTINNWVMKNIKPDVTIYVRVPLEIAIQRIHKRNKKLSAFEHTSFLQKLIGGFDTIYKDRKDVILIDGNQKPGKVLQQTLDALYSWIQKNKLIV
jgi:dTMP kinase